MVQDSPILRLWQARWPVEAIQPEINDSRSGGVLLIGRDPGETEVELGRPFVGKAGELLDEMLSVAGWRRQDVNIHNVVPLRPENNLFGLHTEGLVRRGVEFLHLLIQELQPKLVIALGNEANFAMLGEKIWPTAGRGIYGAKDIEDRRGYFWHARGTTILSAIHPAAVLRKEVPGKFLLETDFRRARRFVDGRLPFEDFPQVKHLNSTSMVSIIRGKQLVGWDIETKWGTTEMLCSGYCGDSMEPYVAMYPREFNAYGRTILEDGVAKVGHNGFGFDLPALKKFYDINVQGYVHDTQLMWAALEPEVAGIDETEEQQGTSRMTRKGLAVLPTIYDMNFPWWKDYPSAKDPDYVEKMFVLNGRDCFVTRLLAGTMLKEIRDKGLTDQYRQKITLIPVLVDLQLRGVRIDEKLRKERLELLERRKEQGRLKSRDAGMKFIEESKLEHFSELKKCSCCGGGKLQAQHCWKCGQLPKRPKNKGDWPGDYVKAIGQLYGVKKPTIGDLKKGLPMCVSCKGTGRIRSYYFNPFSGPQQMKLLVEHLGAPKSTFRDKESLDEHALKRILRWSEQ